MYAASVVVSIALVTLSFYSIDLRRLQWTRKQRIANGQLINDRKERFNVESGFKNRRTSMIYFGGYGLLVLGSWVAYFCGAAYCLLVLSTPSFNDRYNKL